MGLAVNGRIGQLSQVGEDALARKTSWHGALPWSTHSYSSVP